MQDLQELVERDSSRDILAELDLALSQMHDGEAAREGESQVIKAEIESDHLKHLPSKTIKDNQILKQAVDKYRSTEHGDNFESFELF